MSDVETPEERIAARFAAQIASGVNFQAAATRNRPHRADLAVEEFDINVLDGDEDKPETDIRGYIVRRKTMTVSIAVKTRDADPASRLYRISAQVRAAAIEDRTLGGLLIGEMIGPYERRHFDGLEESGTQAIEIITTAGAEHGAGCDLDFVLKFATPPDDPFHLVTLREWDGDTVS